jgi:FKBP-type peptidyl-prolyl cis-trans isomerase FkpA
MRLALRYLSVLFVSLSCFHASGQETRDTVTPDGFHVLPGGLQYKIVKEGTGRKKPGLTDHIEMHIHVHVLDSVIFDSRQMNNNNPVPFQITAPKFDGDPVAGFMQMHAGDSALFRIPMDVMKRSGNQLLPWMKEGQEVLYNVSLVSVMTDAEQKKDQEKKSEIQKKADKKILHDYFAKNKLRTEFTESGVYYVIHSEGKGDKPNSGQTISVNYTGKLLNGNVFDSNTDPIFKHVEPLTFEVGMGKVIKGWDEGLQYLRKGDKATLYIPSGLAYGSQDRSPGIPPNSILVFDVEITDIH